VYTKIEQIKVLLRKARHNYNNAAAQHAMNKVAEYGGQVTAYEKCLEVLTVQYE
jgi:hypothetical protein